MRKNIIVLIIMMVVVLVTVIVARITPTTITNNGGFHFFECLGYMGAVLSVLYIISLQQSYEENVILIIWFRKTEVQRS